MAETVTWYLTEVSRATNGAPWTVGGPSRAVEVWFGTTAEWNALSAAEQGAYDIHIISMDGLVDADEARAAMSAYNGSYSFPNNAGFLGTQDIDPDGAGPAGTAPSVGMAVDGKSITSAKEAVIITLDPITATSVAGNYKGGVGHFDPFRPGKLTPPCFTRGTLIRTPDGERLIETLRAGDMVLTADNGPQPILWIMSARLNAARLAADPHLRPIRIRAGALGTGLPAADLLVSPQHRMLGRSGIAQRMFGASEILVAAKHLLAIDGIEIAEDLHEVEYFHILFAAHEIVFANGAEAESLFTGAEALGGIGPALREEVFAIFPLLRSGCHRFKPARQMATGRQGRRFAQRHARNAQHLVAAGDVPQQSPQH
ncbi:Hint domain-containing protein [Paracoccus aurantiacus]|uniref:Hint domain-containing protein n=1 Tax=Paracoccus aurantiacus TaxID=2599412 RepID=A0A5C6S5F5_9RHOB|nr:Hint domain-containing protein [Paracoccus aurantiacus]TXB69012.1 Hint domain-containing protein [Paracoccus aurantiacus]